MIWKEVPVFPFWVISCIVCRNPIWFVHENPKSNIAESFRALRTNLQYMLTGSLGKVISIHSTNPSEGKSFTAINLSAILAVNNKKVLLFGADSAKTKIA